MLEITPQRAADPAASIELDESMISATQLQKRLFQPDHSDLPGRLLRVAHGLANKTAQDASFLSELNSQYNITAADGAYARMIWAAVSFRGEAPMDLIQTTRQLGSGAFGYKDTIEHVRTGPISLLESGIEENVIDAPVVELELSQEYNDAKSTQRKRLIDHLDRLTPGVDVRITGSNLQIRKLLEQDGQYLPDSVNERAQQSHIQSSSTVTAERAAAAEDALEEIALDHDGWDILEALARTRAQRLTYETLYDAADVSDSAVRKRISRLRDHDLVETRRVNGDQSVLIAPVGEVALDKHPHVDLDEDPSQDSLAVRTHHDAVGSPRTSADSKPQDNGDSPGAVSDPRNASSSTVSSNAYGKPPRDRRVAPDEAAPGPQPGSPSVPKPDFMSFAKHHAVASAAESADISLLDRHVDPDQDRRQPEFSYDEDRDEVVISVNASPNMALTGVRLCSALLSDPALKQVLTRSRLAGGVSKQGLGGLMTDNPYVLQRGPQLGWMQAIEATAAAYRDRLESVRKELLAQTQNLKDEDGYSSEVSRDLLQKAHGLRGVVLQLYKQLGVDVVEEITLPDGADGDLVDDLHEFLGMLSSVGSSYDYHSAHRVLFEQRSGKRSFMFEPDIDLNEPSGEMHSSIVISGDNASDLQEELDKTGEELELQEGEPNFERFLLPISIDDANSRQTIAIAATRWATEKNMRVQRESVSMLAALVGNVVDASEALSRLQPEDETTELDCKDIRFALSTLDEDRIMPDYCGSTISAIVAALLDATKPVTTAELAEIGDVSKRSIQLNSDELSLLEAAGLIDRTEQGNGNATLWRMNLAFSEERKDDDQPLPEFVERRTANLPNVVAEVLLDAVDDYGVSLDIEVHTGTAESAFYGPLDQRDLQPWIREHYRISGLVRSLAMLVDDDGWLRSEQSTVELGREPRLQQTQIQDATPTVAD